MVEKSYQDATTAGGETVLTSTEPGDPHFFHQRPRPSRSFRESSLCLRWSGGSGTDTHLCLSLFVSPADPTEEEHNAPVCESLTAK